MWKNELKKCIRTVVQLKEYVDIAPEQKKQMKRVLELHPMRITPYYMSLIDWNDPADPVRKMVVFSVRDLDLSGSYDTSGEKQSTKQGQAAAIMDVITGIVPAVYFRWHQDRVFQAC